MTTQEIARRLGQIENALQQLLSERVEQEHYSTKDVAEVLGKAELTVR